MRANPFLVGVLGIVGPRRHIKNRRLAVAVAWRKAVVDARRDGQKLRVIGGKDNGLRLARGRIEKPDLGRSANAIPSVPLLAVAVPRLDDTRRRCGDIRLPEALRVIGGAEYLGESPALIEAGGEWADLG